MTPLSPEALFQRSRIYAQGWNAARTRSLESRKAKAPVNPYSAEPERSRWAEGYAGALANHAAK
jgi:hypothetical protein